jgi:hypothetical protein
MNNDVSKNDDSKIIFSNRHLNYLDVCGLYWYLYKNDNTNDKRLPSGRYINSVDGIKFIEYLDKNSTLLCSSKLVDKKTPQTEAANLLRGLRFLQDDNDGTSFVYLMEGKFQDVKITSPIIVKISSDGDTWYLAAASVDSDNLDEVLAHVNKAYYKDMDFTQNTYFGILMNNGEGIEVKQIPIDDKFSKELDIELNYGKEFVNHHNNIIEKLNTNNNGLFIFHGTAGTGKTTYIKYLAKKFGGKRPFIFIPTTFIDTLTSPNIIPVLLEHKNSVLVLEDAEKAVVSREENQGNESLVSSLLNIGDGILGSMLNLTIVLTFNANRDNVDKALLRKGRLHYEHEFGRLTVEDSQILIDKLGKTYTTKEGMSLAEIYNLETDNNHKEKERAKLGFGA